MDLRRILPIFFVVFTNILGAGVIIPILPLYAEGQFGATALQATILAAVFFGMQFLAAPVLGRISDRIGRRPVLIVSQIGTVISFVLFIYAEQLGQVIDQMGLGFGLSGGLMALYLARGLDGITGGNITTAQAYITDVSSEEHRARALGMIGASFGLGFIFGPAFGGFLATISLTAPFIGAAIITSVSVILTIITVKESLPPEKRTQPGRQTESGESIWALLGNQTILLILAINFFMGMTMAVLQSTFALFSQDILFPDASSQTVGRNVGLMLTFVGFISVINQGVVIGPMVKRFGERQTLILGELGSLLGYLPFSFSSSALMITLFTAPISFGHGVSQPSLQSLITRFSTPQMRGRMLGLLQSANSLALIIGPIWAGYAYDTYSPRTPYTLLIPLIGVAILLSLLLLKHQIPGTEGGKIQIATKDPQHAK